MNVIAFMQLVAFVACAIFIIGIVLKMVAVGAICSIVFVIICNILASFGAEEYAPLVFIVVVLIYCFKR